MTEEREMPDVMDDLESAARQRRQQGSQQAPLPLGYANRMQDAPPPIDWGRAIRQVIFAFGVAFLAAGIVSVTVSPFDQWRDNGILWVAFGAGMAALVMPWPAGFGRKRERSP